MAIGFGLGLQSPQVQNYYNPQNTFLQGDFAGANPNYNYQPGYPMYTLPGNSGSRPAPGLSNSGGSPTSNPGQPSTGGGGGQQGNNGMATSLNNPTGGGGGGAPGPGLNFGDPHPFANGLPPLASGIMSPPGLPSQGVIDRFLPDIFKQPFLQGIEAAGTAASWSNMAMPGAAQYQASLYDPNLNPMEQAGLGAGAYLGALGLDQTFNQINNQYANTPFQASKLKAMADAGNQYAAQMMQTGSQMVRDRQQMATQNLPQVFNYPLQAMQHAQQASGGLYGAGQSAMSGEAEFPLAAYQSGTTTNPVYIQ